MTNTDKQIFCADADMCGIIAKCNPQGKWELWGLSEVTESGEAKYETRLFRDNEFDAVEAENTTSGHTHVKVLQVNNWIEIDFVESKKAAGKPIRPMWLYNFGKTPYLDLFFTHEDENESLESLIARGAEENETVIVDQINAAEYHTGHVRDERLLSVIDYFIKKGSDVNVKDKWGETALTAASYSCDTDIVNLLLQNGAKINDKTISGATAIMNACSGLNIDVVKLLLAKGAEVDSECFLYIFNDNSADIYEMQAQIALATLLLNHKNIDVNAKIRGGRTALMHVADFTNEYDYDDHKSFLEMKGALIHFLLDNGADINAQDDKGRTALMHAIESKSKYIATCLLEQGTDANIKDNNGGTALDYAKKHGVRIIGKLRKKMK